MTRKPAKWILTAVACISVSAWADDNLVKNGAFEKRQSRVLPQNWSAFSTDKNHWHGGFSREDASKGSSSLAFLNTQSKPEYQGVYQEVRVRPGQQFEFSVYVANDPDHPLKGFSRGQMSIEWYDSQGKEVSRDWSQSWGVHVSKEKWVKYSMGGTAPPKAVQGHFVITLFSEGETEGGFLVDDVTVFKSK